LEREGREIDTKRERETVGRERARNASSLIIVYYQMLGPQARILTTILPRVLVIASHSTGYRMWGPCVLDSVRVIAVAEVRAGDRWTRVLHDLQDESI
jgi:hypothetical protein